MAPQQALTIGALVWAKVEPYPWWPGRIVKTLIQQRQRVYKIAFFADPTYTYLHLNQILPFSSIDSASNDDLEHNPVLQKAVRLALAHQNKLNALQDLKTSPQYAQSPSSLSFPQKTEEFREQNSMVSEQREVTSSPSFEQQVQQLTQEAVLEEVTQQNVFKLLQRLRIKKVRPAYCYQKRKQEIRYQDRLKDQLLKRYNLVQFDNKNKKMGEELFQDHQKIQITVTTPKLVQQKKSKKINKNALKRSAIDDHIDFLTKRCARKIYTILKNSQNNEQNPREQSMQLVKRMLVLADNNSMKLKSLFVTLVRSISCMSGQLSCNQKLSDFKHYLQRLQGQKGQDQEGSKITQIEANLN